MAGEVVAVVVSASLQKAKSIALNEIESMLGFPQQLDAMEGHVEAIGAMLADAESKKSGSHSRRVSLWLNNVTGVAFEAEIVLDELLYESLRRRVMETNGGSPEVCSSFLFILKSRIRDFYFSMMLGSRVRSINADFEKLNSQVTTLNLVNWEHHATADHVAANRETNSFTHRFVEKRAKEKSEIVELLLNSSNKNIPVSVLPITGMGGLGKTTLAKSVYNNAEIKGRFTKRSWTCVSNKVGGMDILRGILESLKGGGSVAISEQNAIVERIQKKLKGERFLFVLDDVWNSEWWENFLNTVTHMARLNSTSGGCCVLITTRMQGVADGMCASPFRLNKLPNDQCWSIVVERVQEDGRNMPEGLEVFKEQLLKRCQGLPLAANAIGGLLRREDWSSIVDRILEIRGDDKGEIGPVLKLSYDYLPSRCIKKCFLYCSVYPKDTLMDGENLIELWMAEGFLQEDVREGKTMEEVGADYLTIILQSSLLEKCWSLGNMKYQIHDLVHDLAESISREKYAGDKYPASRHFALGEEIKDHWNENSTLARIEEGDICDAMLSKCRHARVMYLHFSDQTRKLPNDVGKLIHVRSLTIWGCEIISLPESLCELYNLQTLRLEGCHNLQYLPHGLSNLINLRHLYCSADEELKMAPNMGRLTHLQTLVFFNVGEENGHRIKEVGFMENLKGSLSIRNLEVVRGKEEASLAKLDVKIKMIELKLKWSWTFTRPHNGDNWEDEQVLEGLEPCLTLQRLTITNFTGAQFPRWLWKLSALVSLELDYCKNVTELGHLGDSGFPKLKTLHISGCSQLSSAPTSFPVLEKLDVADIQVSAVRDIISTTTNSLEELRLDGVIGMRSLSDVTESSLSSCLKTLDIWFCADLTEIPSSTLACCGSLELLEVCGCWELVSCPLNLQQTPSLSDLNLLDCPKLFAVDAIPPTGFEHLTNLIVLRIGADSSEQSIDWDGLERGCSTTLRDLGMVMSSRTELPQQLQHFSSLGYLHIWNFDSLERLPDWMGKLTSLQHLQLLNCPKLQHLPTDAIRSIIQLKLSIEGCPLLRETQGDEIEALPNLQVYWEDYKLSLGHSLVDIGTQYC